MIKKIIPVILMVLMISAAVFAKNEATKVSGSLEKITSKSITIKDGSSENKDFAINLKTQYLVNNKASRHVTLKQGDKVTLEVDSKNNVLSINVENSEG